MGKKPKVNKLARMSDEERARYLQHRADIEEEARRRKRELIARFIKNKLDKEETYSRMNRAKINQEWRYILRRIKCKQMALDIQGMVVSCNFMMERKDRLLSSLMRAIDDSDEQHRRAFQAHTETVSYFLSVGSQRLDKLQNEYEYQKNLLLENWDKEELEIIDCQDKAEFKLKLITFVQDIDFQLFKKEKAIARATGKNDARLEHEEEMRALCRPKQLDIDTYWGKLREVYSGYLEQHSPIMSHYQSLREKDQFYQRDIARNDALINQAMDNVMNLQSEWVKMTTSMTSKLSRMASHKEELSRKYWEMKRNAQSARGRGRGQLAVMVNTSQDAIRRLEDVNEKLSKISQLFDICRKYEHAGDTFLQEADNDLDLESVDFENLDGAMINECKEYSKLDKFMLKVNRAKVQTICLKAEKAKLARENVQLKHYIKKYLTELALRGKDRPLSMTIHSHVHRSGVGEKSKRPVTCIEGALSNAVMHEKRMQLIDRKTKDAGGMRAYPRVQCWMGTA